VPLLVINSLWKLSNRYKVIDLKISGIIRNRKIINWEILITGNMNGGRIFPEVIKTTDPLVEIFNIGRIHFIDPDRHPKKAKNKQRDKYQRCSFRRSRPFFCGI
jgi:hypothetical protein